MSTNVVEVSRLEKVFKDFWRRPRAKAVNDISFSIQSGEVFGLLGPNGSGKSTTIKMLLGLLDPTGGRIAILGKSPRDVKVKERIGYLPEESWLYPWLTASETLDFYGKLFNIERGERRRRIDQLLEMVGLQHTKTRRIGEFSKGMARRVGLAQALINDPDIIILDEPTSGLDPIGCRQVKDLISSLAKRGKTILLSSHLLADVEDVCDRVAILFGGRIQAMGAIKDLLKEDQRVQIRLPELSKEDLKRVLARMREELGSEPEVEHPTRDLEDYFLSVIEAARSEGKESSGAASSSGLASYLGGTETAPLVSGGTSGAVLRFPEEGSQAGVEDPTEPSREDIEARLKKLTEMEEDAN